MKTCETCRFFKGGFAPHCRRYPPVPTSGNNATFPVVNEREWQCGEHRLSILRYLKTFRRRLGPLSS